MANDIPVNELELLAKFISCKTVEYPSGASIINAYKDSGYTVISDPESNEITDLIAKALETKTPFSVIRIGDGEGNLMTYLKYPDTPNIDITVANAIINAQADTFLASHCQLLLIRELMNASTQNADIVGVRGLWHPKRPVDKLTSKSFEKCMTALKRDIRGISGVHRSTHFMLDLCTKRKLDNSKIIASAHLYLSILQGIDKIVKSSKSVLLITNHHEAHQSFKERWNNKDIKIISIGKNQQRPSMSMEPDFLYQTHQQIPSNLEGTLCLIGAGPWSEIYCSFVKDRGGVAVDLGSGFDLIRGKRTRPIHQKLNATYFDFVQKK